MKYQISKYEQVKSTMVVDAPSLEAVVAYQASLGRGVPFATIEEVNEVGFARNRMPAGTDADVSVDEHGVVVGGSL